MESAEYYTPLATGLSAVAAEKSAAEAHGILCGLFSHQTPPQQAQWIAEVLVNTEPKGEPARDLLVTMTSVFDATREELDDTELGFTPLLPGDDAPLGDRAAALGEWCEGFLFGLGSVTGAGSDQLSGEAGEVVTDFGEIARVDAESELGEEGEAAYAELLEYVRMGALLVREAMKATDSAKTAEPSNEASQSQNTTTTDAPGKRLH